MEERLSMDRTNVGERAFAAVTQAHGDPEAIEFVRFCYRRRRVGWPELYDEMCAVAGRGLYQGYGPEELASIGIGFGLFQMPALAVIVARVVAEDLERRRRTAAAIRASLVVGDAECRPATSTDDSTIAASSSHDAAAQPETTEVAAPAIGAIRLALAGA
jgi:hypothetical protein